MSLVPLTGEIQRCAVRAALVDLPFSRRADVARQPGLGELIQLGNRGLTMVEMAETTGLSYTKVRTMLREHYSSPEAWAEFMANSYRARVNLRSEVFRSLFWQYRHNLASAEHDPELIRMFGSVAEIKNQAAKAAKLLGI